MTESIFVNMLTLKSKFIRTERDENIDPDRFCS